MNIKFETDNMRLTRLIQILISTSHPKLGISMVQSNTTHKSCKCSECGLVFMTQQQWMEHMKKHHDLKKGVAALEFVELASINHDILLVDSMEGNNQYEYENKDTKAKGETHEDVSYEILYQPESFSEEKRINISK